MSLRLTAQLIDELTAAALRAGAEILEIRRCGVQARTKPDGTPITAADHAAERVLLEALPRLLPGVPVVSEEARRRPTVLGDTFVLVDPLDGTKEFVAGRDEFTVNIAVLASAVPVAGIVLAPARGLVWRGWSGHFADRLAFDPGTAIVERRRAAPIHTRAAPSDGLVALTSRSHPDPASERFLSRLPVSSRVPCGSSLKFCLIAEGAADVYPRLAPTSEWDLAAGHAIVAAAGGSVVTADGGTLKYGEQEQGFRVPGFVAWGDFSMSVKQMPPGRVQSP